MEFGAGQTTLALRDAWPDNRITFRSDTTRRPANLEPGSFVNRSDGLKYIFQLGVTVKRLLRLRSTL